MVMKIKEKRIEAGLTQVALATQVGVSQSTITGWETETYLPRVRDLPLLAKALSCSISDLFVPLSEEAC